jgi:hypothetical protein
LTYAANLSFPLIISGIILLLTLQLGRGGIGLVVGIMLYLGMSIASQIALLVAQATESALGVQIISMFSPNYALQYHYRALVGASSSLWNPTLSETMLYIGGSYAIVAALFILGYIYFSRRLNL